MRQTVITIPAIKEIRKKIRVAAYVRVSTSKEDQLNSFAAQYVHYTKLFENSEFEELVDKYGADWNDDIYIYKNYDWDDYDREMFNCCGYEIPDNLLDFFYFDMLFAIQ